MTAPEHATPDWFSPRRFAAILGILILARYPQVLFGSESFFFRDFGMYGYPVAHYWRNSILTGELPLWNPLSNCGIPFLAQWSTLVFYPLSVIYLIGPMPWALNFFLLLHLFIAGMAMYFLARHYTGNSFAASIAGVAYVFNGLMINCLAWPHYMVFWAWTPLLFLAMEHAWRHGGRWIILATFIGAMQMLAGVPEFILLSWLLLGMLWLAQCFRKQLGWRKSFFRMTAVVLLIAGLTAIQTFPFLAMLQWSDRSYSGGTDIWSMPLSGGFNLLLPLFGTAPTPIGVFFQPNQWVTSSYYPGTLIVALALIAATLANLRSRLFFITVIIGLWLALGPSGYLYTVIGYIIPAFQLMRFPIKFVMLVNFSLPLLAAFAVAHLQRQDSNKKYPALIFATLICALVIGVGLFISSGTDSTQVNTTLFTTNAVARLLLLIFAVAAFLFIARAPTFRIQVGVSCLFLFLLWLDLRTHVPLQNPTVAPWAFEPDVWQEEFGPAPKAGESRLLLTHAAQDQFLRTIMPDPEQDYSGRRMGFAANCNLLDAIPKTDGFFSLRIAHESQLDAFQRLHFTNGYPERLADFLAVSYVNSPDNVTRFQQRTSHLPMVTMGQQPVPIARDEMLDALISSEFNPSRFVCVDPEDESLITGIRKTDARILGGQFESHHITMDVESPDRTVVVVAQTFYPAWKAYVNGQQTPILRANYAFQAVPIPAGRHHIEFRYEDSAFEFGAVISILTLLGCVVVLVLHGRKKGSGTAG